MPTIQHNEGTHTVHLDLGERSYDVQVGEGILSRLGEFLTACGPLGRRCALISDQSVSALHGPDVYLALDDAGYEVTTITVPSGEASKSMEVATGVCREMLQAGLDRKSFVVALGGGVIGDLAGFAAAIFQRGIPFVQIPTTVVSQVDSSVGGKTGVNTPEGKNLLGAFHQPRLVIADTATLRTLRDREYNQGFAEVIKHAAIRDAAMFEVIESQGLSRDELAPLIARNVAIKADVVETDERETAGTRALLNFGHTLGHGIENAAGYGALLHGEAISLGLVAAARLSVEHSGLTQTDCDRLIALLESYQLPTTLPADIDEATVIGAMQRDKKFEEGAIRFVLLRSLGDAFVSDTITQEDLRSALSSLRN